MWTMEDVPLTTEISRLPARANPIAPGCRVTFLGHASTVIEIDGLRIVTDPVLRRLVGPLYQRVPQPLTEPVTDPDRIVTARMAADAA